MFLYYEGRFCHLVIGSWADSVSLTLVDCLGNAAAGLRKSRKTKFNTCAQISTSFFWLPLGPQSGKQSRSAPTRMAASFRSLRGTDEKTWLNNNKQSNL